MVEFTNENCGTAYIDKNVLRKGIPIIDLLISVKLSNTRSEAKRDIKSGCIKINGKQVTDITYKCYYFDNMLFIGKIDRKT